MKYLYDGLAVDGDGEYFAVFKEILTGERVLLDHNGAFFWFKNDVNHEFNQDEISLALADLRTKKENPQGF